MNSKKSMGLNSMTGSVSALLSIALLALAVLARIARAEGQLASLANVTPFFAISILVGFIMGRDRAWLSGLMAAVAMLIGDLVLGFHWTMAFVYAGIALSSTIGAFSSGLLLGRKSWVVRVASAFMACGLASTAFFIISNVGVWLVGGLYPQTIAGLGECFAMAIPFFTKSLSADLLYGTSFLLIAAWALEALNTRVRQPSALGGTRK